MLPEIMITSRRSAEDIFKKSGHDGVRHVVSIGDVGSKTPFGYHEILARKMRIEFDDISNDAGVKAGYVLPSIDDVAKILVFVRGIDDKALFHCEAGVSRSTAAAVLFVASKIPAGSERAACDLVKAVQPYANPNRKMIEHGDKILRRNGLLMMAVNEVFHP